MKSVCVYCGARTGNADIYRAQAAALGAALVNSNTALVYGGGNVGLMGSLPMK
jgi:predicted Rossmann-fold nucleotide-binding protein